MYLQFIIKGECIMPETKTYPLAWDQEGERFYETGVQKVVLYVYDSVTKAYKDGVAWNGVTAISESPSGAEATALYANDSKYLNLISNEEYAASIEAYTYPDEFAECDGSAELTTGVTIGQQPRKTFGLCYRTTLGNDVVNRTKYDQQNTQTYGFTIGAPVIKNKLFIWVNSNFCSVRRQTGSASHRSEAAAILKLLHNLFTNIVWNKTLSAALSC